MKLETLFLDAGGVLVHPNWDRVAACLEKQGISVVGADLRDQAPFVMRELDRPEPQSKVAEAANDESRGLFLYRRVLERVGIDRSDPGVAEKVGAALAEARRYHDQFNLWEVVAPSVPETLRRFRDLGIRLIVVSNANATLERMLQRQSLAKYFDVIIDSAVVGVEKPDPRIFEIALERSGANRSTTIHVGDLFQVDIVGARLAGIAAVLIDGADQYPEVDCPRFRSIRELSERIEELSRMLG